MHLPEERGLLILGLTFEDTVDNSGAVSLPIQPCHFFHQPQFEEFPGLGAGNGVNPTARHLIHPLYLALGGPIDGLLGEPECNQFSHFSAPGKATA